MLSSAFRLRSSSSTSRIWTPTSIAFTTRYPPEHNFRPTRTCDNLSGLRSIPINQEQDTAGNRRLSQWCQGNLHGHFPSITDAQQAEDRTIGSVFIEDYRH